MITPPDVDMLVALARFARAAEQAGGISPELAEPLEGIVPVWSAIVVSDDPEIPPIGTELTIIAAEGTFEALVYDVETSLSGAPAIRVCSWESYGPVLVAGARLGWIRGSA